MTASHGKSVGEVYADLELRTITEKVMHEIRAISERQHVSLPEDIVEISLNKAKEFPFETRTSFQRDVETPGKRHEGELFGKSIIRLGERLDVDTSATRSLYRKIRPGE